MTASELPVLEFTLSGDVDLDRRDELEELLDQVEASDAAHVVLDVTDVGFMDSTGLRMLVLLNVLTAGRGGRVTVLCPQRSVRRAMHITGVELLVDIVEGPPACPPEREQHLHLVE